eukprot:TRINITY_DN768_c0_g1_i1.p1 TRINITY_DN768_c0_g1~~TRINITY_DN768_c0_g1_i1.p1  ORF type:complete len:394 (+),score=72.31 TRINITY_DN768_c0_g1_i1:40-1221(+)
MQRVAIVGAKRTPLGAFQGSLAALTAPQLGAAAIIASLQQAAPLTAAHIEECQMGNVLGAGIGQAPARQAALGAGLPQSVPCTTVNKVCGSGMKTIMNVVDAIRAGSLDIAVAGGMESMSNAPYLLPGARGGYRMGHRQVVDSMIHDGLWDPYDNVSMGNCGDICAKEYSFTRQDQDAYATETLRRAKAATASGAFKAEIVDVKTKGRKGEVTISKDEQPEQLVPEKIPTLKPAFNKDGTITAANSSSINDGAAALVLASERKVKELGLTPLAWVTGHGQHAQEPKWFTTAPAHAVRKVLAQLKLEAKDIDLWEINEAFAVVTMAAIRDLKISHDAVNIHGGACALGHPIGASGARIVVSLIYALQQQKKQRGIATLCIGGGEATALAIELPH